jgi:hypothetical protein
MERKVMRDDTPKMRAGCTVATITTSVDRWKIEWSLVAWKILRRRCGIPVRTRGRRGFHSRRKFVVLLATIDSLVFVQILVS